MAERWIIVSGRGGCGKTALTANLGAALAARGQRVCLVDADTGRRDLDLWLGLEDRVFYDLSDLLQEECRLDQALVWHTACEKLALLPASQSREPGGLAAEDWQRLMALLEKDFDWILLDAPAGPYLRPALAAVDAALLLLTPSSSGLRAAERMDAWLASAGVRNICLLISRLHPGQKNSEGPLSPAALAERLDRTLLGTLPESAELAAAAENGTLLALENNSSLGALYRGLAAQLLGEEDAPEKGLRARLKRLFSKS